MSSALWIVGSDVATTCTSRIAMNMPTHIIANPIDVETDAAIGMLRSGPFDTARSGQRRILGADPDEEQDRIGSGEDESDPGQAKAKGQGRDFANHDDIVWMRDEAIGAVRHKGRARKDDDARGPTRAKRHESPDPQNLERQEDCEPGWIDHTRRAENPQTG